MPKCSVIIINYNTWSLTLQAIRSVMAHHGRNDFEIIIVDNASDKEDFHKLKINLLELGKEKIQLIRSRINIGFGAGNMLGIQQAKGEYYAFLNSDAYLVEDSISIMIDFLENHSNVSIVGAKSLDENGKAYKAFDHRLSLRKELFGEKILNFLSPKKYPSRKKTFSKPTKVGAVPGSFFICRATDFDKVGGFDSNLFLFYEERDLSFRIEKDLGKEIYSLPETSYVHLKGKSTRSSYEMKKELKISQFYSIRKNLGPLKYALFFLANLFITLFKAAFKRKNRNHLLLLLKGASLTESLKHKQKIIPYSE